MEATILLSLFSERVGTVVKLWHNGSLSPGVAMEEIALAWVDLNKSASEVVARKEKTKPHNGGS